MPLFGYEMKDQVSFPKLKSKISIPSSSLSNEQWRRVNGPATKYDTSNQQSGFIVIEETLFPDV